MKYRVRYSIWTVEAKSPAEAKKMAIDMLKRNLDGLVSVEVYTNTRPLWLRILTGR